MTFESYTTGPKPESTIEYLIVLRYIPASRRVNFLSLITAIAEWRGENVGGIEAGREAFSFVLDTRTSDRQLAIASLRMMCHAIANVIGESVLDIKYAEVIHE